MVWLFQTLIVMNPLLISCHCRLWFLPALFVISIINFPVMQLMRYALDQNNTEDERNSTSEEAPSTSTEEQRQVSIRNNVLS